MKVTCFLLSVILIAGCADKPVDCGIDCAPAPKGTSEPNPGVPATPESSPESTGSTRQGFELTMVDCPRRGGIVNADRDKLDSMLPEGVRASPTMIGYQVVVSLFDCPMNIDREQRLGAATFGYVGAPVVVEGVNETNGTVLYLLEAFSDSPELVELFDNVGLNVTPTEISYGGGDPEFAIHVSGAGIDYEIDGVQDLDRTGGGDLTPFHYVWHTSHGLRWGSGSLEHDVSLVAGPLIGVIGSGALGQVSSAGEQTAIGVAQATIGELDFRFGMVGP